MMMVLLWMEGSFFLSIGSFSYNHHLVLVILSDKIVFYTLLCLLFIDIKLVGLHSVLIS